jgi:MarR family protease production transcriptional regulator HPr
MDKTNFPILINLVRGIYKAMEADLNKSAQSVGLTITELNFLWTIFYEEEPTVSRLAELTLLDPSTVTQVISRLKKKNLVCSFKKEDDNRFNYHKLTPKGDEKRKTSIISSQNRLLDFLVDGMKNPDEQEKINITLKYLKEINLHFHGQEFIHWVYSLPEKLNKNY